MTTFFYCPLLGIPFENLHQILLNVVALRLLDDKVPKNSGKFQGQHPKLGTIL